jgi:hypothetical protein
MFSHRPRTSRPYHASHSSSQCKEKYADPEAIPHGHLSGASLKATRAAYPLGGGQSEFDDTASECSITPSDSVSNIGSRKKEPRESWKFEKQYRMRRDHQPPSQTRSYQSSYLSETTTEICGNDRISPVPKRGDDSRSRSGSRMSRQDDALGLTSRRPNVDYSREEAFSSYSYEPASESEPFRGSLYNRGRGTLRATVLSPSRCSSISLESGE